METERVRSTAAYSQGGGKKCVSAAVVALASWHYTHHEMSISTTINVLTRSSLRRPPPAHRSALPEDYRAVSNAPRPLSRAVPPATRKRNIQDQHPSDPEYQIRSKPNMAQKITAVPGLPALERSTPRTLTLSSNVSRQANST